jgi:hypothetical protein
MSEQPEKAAVRKPVEKPAEKPAPVARHHRARRGDDVEAWIVRWQDAHSGDLYMYARAAINEMLLDYQAHADDGTPL